MLFKLNRKVHTENISTYWVMYVCPCIPYMCRYLRGTEEGFRYPRITGSCEPRGVELGTPKKK